MSKNMTKEKVTLPREVAEAIEKIRTHHYGNSAILSEVYEGNLGDRYSLPFPVLIKYYSTDGRHTDDLMSALVNGYNVEQSPEDRLREYYDELKCREYKLEYSGVKGGQFRQGWQSVERTLEILGITIEGINA